MTHTNGQQHVVGTGSVKKVHASNRRRWRRRRVSVTMTIKQSRRNALENIAFRASSFSSSVVVVFRVYMCRSYTVTFGVLVYLLYSIFLAFRSGVCCNETSRQGLSRARKESDFLYFSSHRKSPTNQLLLLAS